MKRSVKTIWLPIIIIIIVVTVGYMAVYAHNPFSLFTNFVKGTMVEQMDKPAPEITGIESWINSDPVSIESLRGKVVLIDFWTYSCINCQRSLPYVVAWDEQYRDQGLVVIGVHTPEFRFEEKRENVEQAVEQYNIEYPVALDNDYITWRAFHNRYWPAKYLIDKEGNIVYRRFGEGAYDVTEAKIQELLNE